MAQVIPPEAVQRLLLSILVPLWEMCTESVDSTINYEWKLDTQDKATVYRILSGEGFE